MPSNSTTTVTNQIESAKTWFENNPILNNFILLEFVAKIDWEKAQSFEDSTNIAIEVPIVLKQNISLTADQSTVSTNRLLFIKGENNIYTSYIINISSSKNNLELINNLTKLNYFNIPNDFTGKVLVIKNNTKSANISIIIDGKEKIKEDNIYAKAPSVSCYEVIQLYDTGPPRQTGITFCVDDSGYNPYTNQTSYTYHGGGGAETTPDDVQIINGLTGKALCIYNLLNSSSSDFADDIKKFDGEFPVSHLKLTINNN